MRQTIFASFVPLALAASMLTGCGGSGVGGGAADAGTPADMTTLANGCVPLLTKQPPMAGDTWDTYAKGFFASYCTRCHSMTLTGDGPRNGAPAGYNWDDETSVQKHLADIRQAAGEQNFMPPSAPVPACAERKRIVQWIDANAP